MTTQGSSNARHCFPTRLTGARESCSSLLGHTDSSSSTSVNSRQIILHITADSRVNSHEYVSLIPTYWTRCVILYRQGNGMQTTKLSATCLEDSQGSQLVDVNSHFNECQMSQMLWSRHHNYTLPNNNTTLLSNNFINRVLFAVRPTD